MMVTILDRVIEPLLCPPVLPVAGNELIGSASTFDQLIALELPLPWPSEVWQAPHVPPGMVELFEQARQRPAQIRFWAVVPDWQYSRPGYPRVWRFDRPGGPWAAYRKAEFIVPNRQLLPLLEALLEQPANLPRFAPFRQKTESIRDLFVCTHGSRDVCCGKFGYPLYHTLRQGYSPASSGRLRTWRVSHIGGHQFAPTLIDLPEGRYWGALEEKVLETLVWRRGPLERLRRHYRGWAGLNFYEQVVERQLLMQTGWPWLAYQKAAQTLDLDESRGLARVRLSFFAPDGALAGAYEAIVEKNKANFPLSGEKFNLLER